MRRSPHPPFFRAHEEHYVYTLRRDIMHLDCSARTHTLSHGAKVRSKVFTDYRRVPRCLRSLLSPRLYKLRKLRISKFLLFATLVYGRETDVYSRAVQQRIARFHGRVDWRTGSGVHSIRGRNLQSAAAVQFARCRVKYRGIRLHRHASSYVLTVN